MGFGRCLKGDKHELSQSVMHKKKRLELHNGRGMGVTVSGIRAGEKIQKLTGSTTSLARWLWAETRPRHLAGKLWPRRRVTAASAKALLQTASLLADESVMKYLRPGHLFFGGGGFNWFVCVSSFYLGHHLNGLMDLHTKCCPMELFCMLCAWPLNQASLALKALALAHCWITCVLNHCGEAVTMNELHWI